MENYAVLFPSLPSSSSSHQFSPHLQPFSSTMISTQPTFGSHHLHGNPTDVFWGMKEENSRFVSSSDGYPRVLQIGNYGGGGGSSDGAATGRPTGKIKKGEKKIKKPKYAFQTRSQVDILDDGYRWRKYGQKAVKNNRFPRNYYKCTHQGCNVKKQVQRHTKDEGIVVTTYEGMHTHPIEKTNDNFEHILSQMQIYSNF